MAKKTAEKQAPVTLETAPEAQAVAAVPAVVAAPLVPATLPGLPPEFSERMREMQESLETFSDLKLPIIRFKEGFTFAEGDEPVEDFEGVIVYTKETNIYYQKRYQPGSAEPPTCMSLDGIKPCVPNPVFANCKACPKNQFGSADGSDGKACKNTRPVFIVTPGAMLPRVLRVPPTSLPGMKSFILNTVTDHGSYMSVMTRFSAYKKDESQTHWNIRAEIARKLTAEEKLQVQALRATWLTFMREVNTGMPDEDEGGTAATPPPPPTPADASSGAQY